MERGKGTPEAPGRGRTMPERDEGAERRWAGEGDRLTPVRGLLHSRQREPF